MGHGQREGSLGSPSSGGEDGGVKSQMLDVINTLESDLIGRAPSRTRGAAFQKTFRAKSGSATTKTRLSSLICLLLPISPPQKKPACRLQTAAPVVLALCTCRRKGTRVCVCASVCFLVSSPGFGLRVHLRRTAGCDWGGECIVMLRWTVDMVQLSRESVHAFNLFCLSIFIPLHTEWYDQSIKRQALFSRCTIMNLFIQTGVELKRSRCPVYLNNWRCEPEINKFINK